MRRACLWYMWRKRDRPSLSRILVLLPPLPRLTDRASNHTFNADGNYILVHTNHTRATLPHLRPRIKTESSR